MNDSGTLRDTFFRVRTVLVAVTLLCTFALHSIQVMHDHPSHAQVHTTHATEQQSSGEEAVALSEYMHATDKKTLAILATITLLALSLLFVLADTTLRKEAERTVRTLITIFQKRRTPHKHTYYLQNLFSNGILHPKLF